MDPHKNPFSPGAGTPPPELAGRDAILTQADLLLSRVLAGRSEKSFLAVGLRGVGKTVLLNDMQRRAESFGYRSLMVECHDGKSLAALLAPGLRQILFALDSMAAVSEKTRRGLAVLKSFLSSLKVTIADIEFGINPERGTADSGNIEVDLPDLFVAVGEAAKDRHVGIAILIDELQYLAPNEFSALIMAMHRMAQKSLPIVLFGAGLPQIPALAGDSKSYAERLFDFPDVGPLVDAEARRALVEPVGKAGVKFTEEALVEIIRMTEGYPYFLQEWGYHSWNVAPMSPIDHTSVKAANELAVARLDKAFFRVRYDRLSDREREYMRALAELGPGVHRSGEVAKVLQGKVNEFGTVRDGLIKKGMIYSREYGSVAFTVPLFDQFMRRTMPDKPSPWNRKKKRSHPARK